MGLNKDVCFYLNFQWRKQWLFLAIIPSQLSLGKSNQRFVERSVFHQINTLPLIWHYSLLDYTDWSWILNFWSLLCLLSMHLTFIKGWREMILITFLPPSLCWGVDLTACCYYWQSLGRGSVLPNRNLKGFITQAKSCYVLLTLQTKWAMPDCQIYLNSLYFW